MTDKYQRAKWPEDTAERITKMRGDGMTWQQIATDFGVGFQTIRTRAQRLGILHSKGARRFTSEEDQILRAEWIAYTPIEEIAAKLQRSSGVIRQRIYYHHGDLRGVRSQPVSLAVRRFGRDVLKASSDPVKAAQITREAVLNAKAAARMAAINARNERRQRLLTEMLAAVPNGRDDAIFAARAAGLELQAIGDALGITRERVRQIYHRVAFERALKAQPIPKQDASEAEKIGALLDHLDEVA